MSLLDLRPGDWCFVERLNPSIRMWQSLNYVDIASFKVLMKCCQSNRSLKALQTYIHFIYINMFNLVFKCSYIYLLIYLQFFKVSFFFFKVKFYFHLLLVNKKIMKNKSNRALFALTNIYC